MKARSFDIDEAFLYCMKRSIEAQSPLVGMVWKFVERGRECTMQYDKALRHTSSVGCLETFRFIFSVTLPLVRSNSWDAHLAVPNDPRYARMETNLGIGQAKEM
ncbi:hypothetical protein TNCV_2373631 [Trichonephila clavipes]|nr:hypothetical protein TNCV_2373631 [Trichonephila clavipes]